MFNNIQEEIFQAEFTLKTQLLNTTQNNQSSKCQIDCNNKIQGNQSQNQSIQSEVPIQQYHEQNQDITIEKKKFNKKIKFENIQTISNSKTQSIEPQDLSEQESENQKNEISIKKIDFKIDHKQKELQQKIEQIFNKVNPELQKRQYFIEGYINSGGQACVLEGYFLNDKGIKEECALKIYFQASSKEFQKEIEIMKSFEKPFNVIKIIDSFEIGELFVLILEKCLYSLHDELKQIKEQNVIFSIDKLLQIIFDLLDGLAQFRIYNILHLDIKPGNILISNNGKYCYSDFGTSFYINEDIEIEFFTKKYASPEQINFQHSIDYQSDVYSLGKTFEVIIDVFKKQSLDYKNDQKIQEFIKFLEEAIDDNMILPLSQERLQCLKLHQLILQKVIDQFKSGQLRLFYNYYYSKLYEISNLFQYTQNKDQKYFQLVQIFYCETILYLFKNDDFLNYINNSFAESLSQNELNQNQISLFKNMQIKNVQDQTTVLESIKNIKHIEKLAKNKIIIILAQTNYFNRDYKTCLKYSFQSLEMRKIFHQDEKYLIDHYSYSLSIIGQCYVNLEDYEMGLEYFLELLELRQSLKVSNTAMIQTLDKIAECYFFLGEYQSSLIYSYQSLNISKQIFKNNEPSINSSLFMIAMCYRHLRDFQNSLKFSLENLLNLKWVIQMKSRVRIKQEKNIVFHQNHPNIASSISLVGLCYVDVGQIKKGLQYEEKSLKIRKLQFHGDHHAIATSLTNLGNSFRLNKDYVKGLKYSLESLEMFRQIYEIGHPDTYATLNNIGLCYVELGDNQTGLKYLKESLQIIKQFCKENNPLKITPLSNLGLIFMKMGEFQNSLKYFLECLKLSEQIYQGNHIEVVYYLNYIGDCYYQLDQYQNSLNYYHKSLKMNEQIFQGNHTQIIQSLSNICKCYSKLGDHQNCLKYSKKLKDLSNQQQGQNTDYDECLKNLATCSYRLNDFKNSLIYYLEILQIHKQNPQKYLQQIPNILSNIGTVYVKLGDHKNGLKYLLESIDMLNQFFKENQFGISANLNGVVICYYELGLFEKALKYKLKHLKMNQNVERKQF